MGERTESLLHPPIRGILRFAHNDVEDARGGGRGTEKVYHKSAVSAMQKNFHLFRKFPDREGKIQNFLLFPKKYGNGMIGLKIFHRIFIINTVKNP
jgi:hypothetical protein